MRSPRFDSLGVLMVVDCPCGGIDWGCEHEEEIVEQADWIYALTSCLAQAGAMQAMYDAGWEDYDRSTDGDGLWRPNTDGHPAPAWSRR